jgi:hypothetical protein
MIGGVSSSFRRRNRNKKRKERERGREATLVFFLGHKKHWAENSSLFASHVESIKIHYLYFIFQNAPCTNF